MPPVIPVDQELILKKRARRRLVGAIALVVLLMIILPIVLKDRVLIQTNDNAKISINEVTQTDEELPHFESASPEPITHDVESAKVDEIPIAEVAITNKNGESDAPKLNSKPEPSTNNTSADLIANKIAEVESKQALESHKTNDKTANEIVAKNINTEPASNNLATNFTIQVGAFSDLNNMKQTQATLTKSGFSTTTEKIKTPNGESIRLMTGNYPTRELANEGLLKIKALGLNGLIKPSDQPAKRH